MPWLKAILGGLAAVGTLWAYLTGRRDGATKEKHKTLKKGLQEARKANAASSEVRGLSDSDISERLRDFWRRK